MTVRGSKNRILIYIGAALTAAALVLLYHNASQRLFEADKLYEKCHMNEESLSAQLQVVFEYKVRLEKTLQQEKNDHRVSKEELQGKLEEERQQRERDNTQSISKFTALQQQYKLLQSQHEDVNNECNKIRQQQLADIEEKTQLESQIRSLQLEVDKLKESKVSDMENLKTKYLQLQEDKEKLTKDREELSSKLSPMESKSYHYEKQAIQYRREIAELKDKLAQCGIHPQNNNEHLERREDTINEPETAKRYNQDKLKSSSTKASKIEREFSVPNNIYINTSTPMINPEALLSQENKTIILGLHKLDQEHHIQLNPFQQQNNVEIPELMAPHIGDRPRVLPAPGLLNQFHHVPAVQSYREKLREAESIVHNIGGEVGDEGQPLQHRNVPIKQKFNDKIRNDYYKDEYDEKDLRKEEEDDDDVDHIDIQNNDVGVNKIKSNNEPPLNFPEEEKDGVMVNPK